MYQIKSLKKKYKSFEVLKGVNLNIKKGEIIAIVGENGAGKTTLLKTMMNLLSYDSGEILFKNKPLKSYKNDLYNYLGIILEGQNNLYNYIPAIENIYYFGSMLGLNKKKTDEKVKEYLKIFNLEDSKFKNTGDYSTGMLQKLAIVISLLGDPEVLFLDEPTLGLDIKSNNDLILVLKKLQKTKNITIILTSHETETIEQLADKIAYLKQGIITQFDSIDKFKENNTNSDIEIFLKDSLEIQNKEIDFLQKGKSILLKNNQDGNRMLNYLSSEKIIIRSYNQKQKLKDAILNLGGVK